MLATSPNYQKATAFKLAHPDVDVDGDEFFIKKTKAELQQIVDQTVTSLKKKREVTGGSAVRNRAAEDMLKKASSADKVNVVTVTWGVHQLDDDGVPRGGGDEDAVTLIHHFTVTDPEGGNDWHLYIDKAESTILQLSQSAARMLYISNV